MQNFPELLSDFAVRLIFFVKNRTKVRFSVYKRVKMWYNIYAARPLCAVHRYAQRGIGFKKGWVFLSEENYDETFVESAAERLCRVEERAKSNSRRISKFEELANAINSQNENIARLVAQLEAANEKLQSQDERLSAIEKRPGERTEAIVRSILSAIAGALAGALAGILF